MKKVVNVIYLRNSQFKGSGNMLNQKKVVFGLLFGVLMFISSNACAAVITVNSAQDNYPAISGDGKCTLREAIENANSNLSSYPDCLPGNPYPILDEIYFNISGAGPFTINLATDLPFVAETVTIDGTTQSGASCFPRNLLIEISGANFSGINIWPNANGSVIKGLVINDSQEGIRVRASNVFIECNNIGTDIEGMAVVGDNMLNGIVVANISYNMLTQNVNIGGGDIKSKNIIGGFHHGIYLTGGLENIFIEGNHIGNNVQGTQALPNTYGISFEYDPDFSRHNIVIGGNDVNKRNIISGNNVGVELGTAKEVFIKGNYIGTDVSGINSLPNDMGIVDSGDSYDVMIGGTQPHEANLIAYNNYQGIALRGVDSRISMLLNKIFQNGELGIDLVIISNFPYTYGPNLNDFGDLDEGPNDLLNFPALQSAGLAANQLIVDFDLDVNFVTSGTQQFRIDFYANPSGVDPTGHGEGEIWLGYSVVETDAQPGPTTHSVMINVPDSVDSDDVVNLTATTTEFFPGGQLGATSEFSHFIDVVHQVAYDFGDAPDGAPGSSSENYQTVQADGGAAHLLDETIYLGNCVDADDGALQNSQATADDIVTGVTYGHCSSEGDDEDGVTFITPILAGQYNQVKVIAHGKGYLNAWMDFNQDGDWNDSYEHILNDVYLTNGGHTLEYKIPDLDLSIKTYARFRYYSDKDVDRPVGLAKNGEVEDYYIIISAAGESEHPVENPPVPWEPVSGKKR